MPLADIGYGYGSECHLLRYLGRHRGLLDQRVLAEVGATEIKWHDAPFDASNCWGDGEWKGLDFLPADSPARAAYSTAWPTRGGRPNWDAIGRVARADGVWEWLLVEAKAYPAEMARDCGAKQEGGLPLIVSTFARTKAALGVSSERDWLRRYYQYANRIAALHVMLSAGVPARLLFIYFFGDKRPDMRCPAREGEWTTPLAEQDRHLGLSRTHALADRIHKLFLETRGPAELRRPMG